MNPNRAAFRTAGLLTLAGIAGISARLHDRYSAAMARGDSVWKLSYHARFVAAAPGGTIRISFPMDTPYARVFSQQLAHPGLKTEPLRPGATEARTVTAVVQRVGECQIDADFDIHLSSRVASRSTVSETTPRAEIRAKYLRSEPGIQVSDRIVTETLERVREEGITRTELVERLFELCLTDLGLGGDESPRDAAGTIKRGLGSVLGRARAMVALCRAAKVPARLVTGFELKHDDSALPHVWVEVLANSHWEPYDPESGFAHELPANFLPVRRDGTLLVRARKVASLHTTYSIVRQSSPVGMLHGQSRRLSDIFDLTRLPLEMHQVLSVILLVPFGAVATAVFRTIIGVRTFGTFTPTLLALSYVYSDWRTGLIVLVVVLLLGFLSRTLLERLKLLMVPRLSVVLTLVVLCTVLGISLLDYLNLTPSAQAVLLPMVILTMLIERFYLTAEEDTLVFALRLLAGTLVVAFFCYLLLAWAEVGRMVLLYPEVHLITLAVLIMIGRYTGYRLTELWRFRELVEPASA